MNLKHLKSIVKVNLDDDVKIIIDINGKKEPIIGFTIDHEKQELIFTTMNDKLKEVYKKHYGE